jgi:hypothetical protein
MTTTSPRFIRARDGKELRCMGANHRDHGDLGTCGRCGTPVVRLERGRLVEPHTRHTASDGQAFDYACWQPNHVCDEARVSLFQAAYAEELATGALIIGQTVTVVRGRKIAKGTQGIIRWIGEGDFGTRVGLAVEGEPRLVYTDVKNVEATAH